VCTPDSVHPGAPPWQVPLTKALSKAVLDENESMAQQSLRCLAVAVKDSDLGVLENYDGTEEHPGHRFLADSSKYAEVESKMVRFRASSSLLAFLCVWGGGVQGQGQGQDGGLGTSWKGVGWKVTALG
jgi:hypothetical protein